MYAIVRYCMESLDSKVEMDVVGVALTDPDAEEMLACQVEQDFDGVEIYDEVFKSWEWDMEDAKDDILQSQLEEHYLFYHIKICEV